MIRQTTTRHLVCLATVAMVLVFFGCRYWAFLQAKKVLKLANKLSADLTSARLDAVTRGMAVSMCPMKDYSASRCGEQTQWMNGWVVFGDANYRYDLEKNSEKLALRHIQAVSGVSIQANTAQVGFNASGELTTLPLNLLIRPKYCLGTQAKIVSVGKNGQVSIDAATC